MTFLKLTFSQIFVNISFHIGLEAMYIKFGDPKSIIVDFQFSSQKKCLKKHFLKKQKLKKKFFEKTKKSTSR